MSFIIASFAFGEKTTKHKSPQPNPKQKAVEPPISSTTLKPAACSGRGEKEKMKSNLQEKFTTKLTCLLALLLEYKVVQVQVT